MELYKRSKWAAIAMVQFLIFFKTILSQNFSSPHLFFKQILAQF